MLISAFSFQTLRPVLRVSALLLLVIGPINIPATPARAEVSPVHDSATVAEGRFITDLGQEAIDILKNTCTSKPERTQKFRDLLRRTFDLETIARFVLGRNWMRATETQQKEYLDLFEQLVVKTYSDRFTLYTGEGFRVTSVDAQGKKDKVVTSEITHPDGSQATSVVWRVRNRKGKMGIIDVVVEGISMSVTQRQEYSAIIQRNGGDIEALLKMMRGRADGKKEV